MKWNKLTRAEKIAHLFDYPYSEQYEKVQELWGKDASIYANTEHFPQMTPWKEIAAVIKQTGKEQYAYVNLKENDFGAITNDDILNNDDSALALVRWYKKVIDSGQPTQLAFELYDETTLIGRVCTERGYNGDEDGFGVEPDRWACALFDFEGHAVKPFRPNYYMR